MYFSEHQYHHTNFITINFSNVSLPGYAFTRPKWQELPPPSPARLQVRRLHPAVTSMSKTQSDADASFLNYTLSIKTSEEITTKMISGIAHVNLLVPPGTLDQAHSFYGETLGLSAREVPSLQKGSLAW